MAGYDLRPLSLGEILDRTFSLYRSHFLLFIGIAGIPRLCMLPINWAQAALPGKSWSTSGLAGAVWLLAILIVALLVYLLTQAGTVLAVSDIYLGRRASIGARLRRAWDEKGLLFGVTLLNGLACLVGFLALIIPGIYLACRLLVCVPVALIEQRWPLDSLRRGYHLTRDYAGRAFVIGLLFVLLAWIGAFLVGIPVGIAAVMLQNDPEKLRLAMMLMQVPLLLMTILTQPFLLIATAVFYYDLRVRKEAFDLQFMMDPTSEGRTDSTGGFPSILSGGA